MCNRILLTLSVLWVSASCVAAQQAPDLEYKPPLPKPAYEQGRGPRVVVDGAHHNFHTADNRYKPFAMLLQRDGYRVNGLTKPFSAETLKEVDVLVIVNPLHEQNDNNWALPTPSAFTKDEIAAVKSWVEDGGSLFLIADHMPFPGAAGDLAKALGVEFSNGYATPPNQLRGKPDIFAKSTGLKECAVTRGRSKDETVTEIATFTGSAFKLPEGATPVLVFGKGWVSREPKRAWNFTPDTPMTPIERWCQGAILEFGNGRIAVFGEAAMFTAQIAGSTKRTMGMNSPKAKQNYQLLLNVMHWLTRVKGMPEK